MSECDTIVIYHNQPQSKMPTRLLPARPMTEAERQDRKKTLLIKSGGAKIAVNLEADSVQNMKVVMAREGYEGRGAQKQAIVHALAVDAAGVKLKPAAKVAKKGKA